jgi:hypothetical protein
MRRFIVALLLLTAILAYTIRSRCQCKQRNCDLETMVNLMRTIAKYEVDQRIKGVEQGTVECQGD